jgi:hypothetical protein
MPRNNCSIIAQIWANCCGGVVLALSKSAWSYLCPFLGPMSSLQKVQTFEETFYNEQSRAFLVLANETIFK